MYEDVKADLFRALGGMVFLKGEPETDEVKLDALIDDTRALVQKWKDYSGS